jgi:hypothetical protein
MTEGDGSSENPFACARTADNLFWRHAPDRRGDIGVAARGACAAAGGQVSAQHDVRRLGSPRGGVLPEPQEANLVEGQDCAIEYRWAEN